MFVFYDESILSYVSSIRNYFGLNSSYKPNQKFTKILNEEKPKKVFLILIDAMGVNILEKNLSENSFLRKNMKFKVQTVFPTTTTAALTSIQNGKSPNENCWLAWTQYFKEKDDIIIPFQDKGFYNDKQYEKGFVKGVLPITSTVEELNSKGIHASNIFPNFDDENRHTILIPDFGKTKNASLDGFCKQIIDNEKNSDDRYVFCYYDTLDHVMHNEGPYSKKSVDLLNNINDSLEDVANNISDDTMLVIVADHGQFEVGGKIQLKGSKFEKYLLRNTYLDPRAIGFDIKEEYKEEFEKEFMEEFENDYILLNKKQIIDTQLFGFTKNSEKFVELLPDYIGIGKTDKIMYTVFPPQEFLGHHTGISDDEIYIPIIIYKKNKQ